MHIKRRGRKWIIEGNGDGWIYNRTFSTRWKAIIAKEVYSKGGKTSDYWKAAREYPKREMNAFKVRAQLEEALKSIEELTPTHEEIEEYGRNAGYGVVTSTSSSKYYPPRLHDTWGKKMGGRVHIDIGSGWTHLMLNKWFARDFIDFIERKRKYHVDNVDLVS